MDSYKTTMAKDIKNSLAFQGYSLVDVTLDLDNLLSDRKFLSKVDLTKLLLIKINIENEMEKIHRFMKEESLKCVAKKDGLWS